MNYLNRIILLFVVLLMVLYFSPLLASAHGFDTNDVSSEQAEKILNNLVLDLLDNKMECASIECFDVHKDGHYAIGFTSGDKRVVEIYDHNGNFQIGFSFSYGGHYSIAFVEENLEIYLARSNIIMLLSPNGECVHIEDVPVNTHNSEIIADAIYSTEKSIGAYTYFLDRDQGVTVRNYARLIRVDPEGNQKILYDVTSAHNIHVFLSLLFVVGFLCIWALGMKNRIAAHINQSPD